MKRRLKILTWNVGLLDVKFLGRDIIQPAPYVQERLAAIPRALLRHNADIVALQELYSPPHRDFLLAKLKKHYPYHFYTARRGRFGLECSLCFLSRYRLEKKQVVRFRDAIIEESLFVYKGMLKATVNVAGFGRLTLYNLHTAAGWIRDPQNKALELVRGRQIAQVIRAVAHRNGRRPAVILGDVNAGPEVSKNNYELFGHAGFLDAWTALHHSKAEKKVTWEPKNLLNLGGIHRHCPPQRIDHVFINRKWKSLAVQHARIVFHEPKVKVGPRRKVTLSDHYGLSVTLKMG